MDKLEYAILHLSNGATLYVRDEVKLREDVLDVAEKSIIFIGLDGEKYDVMRDSIVFTNYSTPESREKLNELRFRLQAEQAEHSERKLLEFTKRRDEMNEQARKDAAAQHEMELREKQIGGVADAIIKQRPALVTD